MVGRNWSNGQLSTVNTVKRDGAIVDSNSGQPGNQPESTTYHYDLFGRMDFTEMPNSVVEDYTFDNMDRLDVMKHYQSDSNNANLTDNVLKAIYDYDYDPDLNPATNNPSDGKRYRLTETFYTSAPLTNTYTWNYDSAGRLVSEVLDSSDNSIDQTESYIMDLVGNRTRRTTDKAGTANDVTDIYAYDASDRLQSETRYGNLNGTGTATQATTYGWTQTQQTSKTVSVPSVSSVVQAMTYGLNGQLEKVTTTTQNGAGTVTGRTQVEYRYDSQGIRFIAIDTNDTNLSTPQVDGSPTGRTEYLIDHANFTGYQQTILETQYNALNQAVKRINYTFGADEITQTTSVLNAADGSVTSSETLTFGHDGHGSTRVLFGAAAAFAQVFTYCAYGELISIHNASGTQLSNPGNLPLVQLALTSILYNGEGIDRRTGLYNMRARWYSPSSGSWERLDPFAGNPMDPFSFHKYGFVHGDPVTGVDPSGREFTIAGLKMSIGIGALIGSLTGGFLAFRNGGKYDGSAIDILEGAFIGGAVGAIGGAIGYLSFAAISGMSAAVFYSNAGAAVLKTLGISKSVATFWMATFGSGAFTSGVMTAGQSIYEGKSASEVIGDAAEAAVWGAALGGLLGLVFRGAAPLWIKYRGRPQGISEEDFAQVKAEIIKEAGKLSDDIVVQGSRPAGIANRYSDLDIAVKLEEAAYLKMVDDAFGANPTSNTKISGRNYALQNGKINARPAGLTALRDRLEKLLGMKVQTSVILKGGKFDNGAQLKIAPEPVVIEEGL